MPALQQPPYAGRPPRCADADADGGVPHRGFFADHYAVEPTEAVKRLQRRVHAATVPSAALYSCARALMEAWDVMEAHPDVGGLRVADRVEELRDVLQAHVAAHALACEEVAASRQRRGRNEPTAAAKGGVRKRASLAAAVGSPSV